MGKKVSSSRPDREPLLPQPLQGGTPLHVLFPRDTRAVRGSPRQVHGIGSLGAEAAGLALFEEGQADGVPEAGDSLAHLQRLEKPTRCTRLRHLQDMRESQGESFACNPLARGAELLLLDVLQVAAG